MLVSDIFLIFTTPPAKSIVHVDIQVHAPPRDVLCQCSDLDLRTEACLTILGPSCVVKIKKMICKLSGPRVGASPTVRGPKEKTKKLLEKLGGLGGADSVLNVTH